MNPITIFFLGFLMGGILIYGLLTFFSDLWTAKPTVLQPVVGTQLSIVNSPAYSPQFSSVAKTTNRLKLEDSFLQQVRSVVVKKIDEEFFE